MEGEETHGKKVRLNDEKERGQTEENESPRAQSSQQRTNPDDVDEGRNTRTTGTSTSGQIDVGEASNKEIEMETTKGILNEILNESNPSEAPANNVETDDDKIKDDPRILDESNPNEAPENSLETDDDKVKDETMTKETDIKSHSLNSRIRSDSDRANNSNQVEEDNKFGNHFIKISFANEDVKLNEHKQDMVTTTTAADESTEDNGHLKWEKDSEPNHTHADNVEPIQENESETKEEKVEQIEENGSEKYEDERVEKETIEENVDDKENNETPYEDGYTIKTPFKSKDELDENEQAPKEVEHDMEPIAQSKNTKKVTMQSKAPPNQQTSPISKKQDTRKVTQQRKPVSSAQNSHAGQQKSQSARMPTRGNPFPRENTQTSRAISRTSGRSVPSRPRTTGYNTEQRKKEKDFFHQELKRLKESLRSESKKISKPQVRDFYPDVFTSLEPYYNTYTANYLINMPTLGYKEKQPQEAVKEKKADEVEEEADIMFTTRKTAIGLCDPWQSLNMDRQVLPKLETAEIRRRRIESMHHSNDPKPKSAGAGDSSQNNPREKNPDAKKGSTRLPKFPVIHPPNSEISTKELVYSDVPMLRDELIRSFSHFGEDRKKSDYNRTRQDFFRMELDRLDEYHSKSRPHMRAAYFAYLQNTPGSKKAIYDCMKEMSTPRKKKEIAPQAVA